MADQLPPIEEWWAGLSIEARHEILEDLHAPLTAQVRREIGELTGRSVPDGATLSHHEVGFVQVQQEPVD